MAVAFQPPSKSGHVRSATRTETQSDTGVTFMRSPIRRNAAPNCPTPDEISQRAATIRSQWSWHQLRIRAGLPPRENSVEITTVPSGVFDTRGGIADFD